MGKDVWTIVAVTLLVFLLPVIFMVASAHPMILVATMVGIVGSVIAYYIYSNFYKTKTSTILTSEQMERAPSREAVSRAIFVCTLIIFVFIAGLNMLLSGPGEGMVGIIFLLPLLPVLYIFYPIYFTVLTLRYVREGRQMYIFDKLMFYILLAALGVTALPAIRQLLQ
jgi:hypothetical protein